MYSSHLKICKHNTGSSILSNENQGKNFLRYCGFKKVEEDPKELYILRAFKNIVFPWSKLVINVSGFRVFVWYRCYFYQITEWLVVKAICGSLIVLEVIEMNISQERTLNVGFFSFMKYL